MIVSSVTALVLIATGVYMVIGSRYAVTRRMAWIPFVMAAMELAMFGALDLTAYPILTVILMSCRFTVVVCCAKAMKRDAAMERNRRRRRQVWRHIAATAPEACLISGVAASAQKRRCA